MIKTFFSRLFLGNVVHKVETEKDFHTTLADLKVAIERNGFSVKYVHDIKKALAKENPGFENEYRIVQFCNAKKANKALSMSSDVGVMMPKSIIIFEKKGKTFLQFMKMKPFMVKMMFPEIDLSNMSRNVMSTMEKIVNDAKV